MKSQTFKKLFAFIILAIFFLGLRVPTSAQKCSGAHPCPAGYDCVNGKCQVIPTTYFCNCGLHGYGCGGNHNCINYCVIHCSFAKENLNPDHTTSKNIVASDSQPAGMTATMIEISWTKNYDQKNIFSNPAAISATRYVVQEYQDVSETLIHVENNPILR